jgi:hypothetical protein
MDSPDRQALDELLDDEAEAVLEAPDYFHEDLSGDFRVYAEVVSASCILGFNGEDVALVLQNMRCALVLVALTKLLC